MTRRGNGFHRLATLLIGLAVVLAGSAVDSPRASAKVTNHYYVEATGHQLADPFLSRWVDLDGMTTLGLPVSEPLNVEGRAMQYFERGVLGARSRSARAPEIQSLPAAKDLLTERHTPTRTVAGRRVGGDRHAVAFAPRARPDNERVLFDEGTGHTISGRMLGYFKGHGDAERFGSPLSDSYVSGGMRVQWFEHGRLQWRLADERVEAAAVGLELAVARGVDISRQDRDAAPIFEPGRFRRYVGDGTIPQALGPFTPVGINVPAIGIQARVEQVGIENGTMGVPADAWNVGWYPTIATPGEHTNVVMAGHRDWWGVGPVVFYNLEQLNPGHKIYLLGGDGAGFTYQVIDRWLIDGSTDAGEIVADTGREMLTLITCGGAFNGAEYESRWIVRAERI